MVLMLVPATAFADENYMITQNFKYGTRTYDGTDPQTSPYQFVIPAGGSFGLATIEDCSPYELVGWQESVSGTVYPPYAEIQNLQSDLTFDAVYQVQGGLAITVDGFMPGKKVGDCTYTVESTIPGVTFNKSDITRTSWEEYRFDGIGYYWEELFDADVFEADTVYRVVIELNNKGLELAPSTTVNGIEPFTCSVPKYNGVPYAIQIGCELGKPVAPTLAVTVDNFEVGKTPADITYSFASTNLDVTFSEENILNVYWEKYVVDGTGYLWTEVKKTEVFQTDTAYRLLLVLNSHLELAPATTVNGKTPESCEIRYNNGVPIALVIFCEFGTPEPAAITISGPDEVCAEQDCEFSATASEGAEISYFHYRCGEYGGDTGWDRTDDGVCYGTVPASEYGDADSMVLTVYGTAANGKPATATKTVQISAEHIFVDGVCACGAKTEYTITYDGGEGVEGSIPAGVKTHGVDFTLSSETFTWDGFVQTGWIDKETGAIYELGATYDEDRDATFYPYWEKLVTLTVPYTTTVALGDAGVPGEKTFTLALIGDSAPDKDKSNVTVSGSVTTNGKGSYNGTLTITGPEETLWYMLSEGAFVQQVDNGEAGWTVDDTVWGVLMDEIPVAYAVGDDAAAPEYTVYVVPASIDGNGDHTIDWENLQKADMAFTNTYTAHAYELKHDATHHWDECDCGDIQNKEAHTYGDWKVTKEATQTAKGEKEHTCTVCGYTEKTEIPKRTTVASGDDSSFALWAALFTLSAAAVITTVNVSKKKKADK